MLQSVGSESRLDSNNSIGQYLLEVKKVCILIYSNSKMPTVYWFIIKKYSIACLNSEF